MNCYLHPDVAAVAVCANCGKGLCRECAENSNRINCINCIKQENNRAAFSYSKFLLIYAVLFFIGYKLDFMASKESGSAPILSGYCLMAVISGWQFLSKIINIKGQFLFTIETWGHYNIIKLILSAFIGFFTAPFTIIWNIYKLIVSVIR